MNVILPSSPSPLSFHRNTIGNLLVTATIRAIKIRENAPSMGVGVDKPVLKRGIKFVGRCSWVSAIAATMTATGLFIEVLVQAQPAQSQPIFENVRIGPDFSPDPMTIRGISGGAVPSQQVAGRAETPTGACEGFVDEPPDHTINLTAFFNYLSLQVESPEDTTLVVVGPGGSWCNDDFQGQKNPGIAGQWSEGTYRVWVGSYDKDNYHPYIIRISEVELLNPGPYRR